VKTLPSTDVLIIGGGWTGLLMAKELAARTPHSIVILERGGPRNLASYSADMDELDYFVRMHMMQDPSLDTVTLRYSPSQRALPIRQFGAFLPGSGVGGTGEHWGAQCPRLQPDCFELYSKSAARYGEKKLPEGHAMQDWGITYDELEPYYTRAEKMVGVTGKAGNLKGQKIEGGNVFEGWRSTEYPLPPTKVPYFSSLFRDTTKAMGYHPYPAPAAVLSQTYTNPDGITRTACAFCGFCERTGCMIGAKSQPTNVLLPIVQRQKSVNIRPQCTVRRIVHDTVQGKGRARGVVYVDASGEEVFQPADLVILASWTLSNNRLLLLSKAGTPYDPVTGKGTLGRNLTHQVSFSAATLFMDKPLNRFMGAGGVGIRMSDFDGDVFDHSNLGFLRGGVLGATMQGTQPISTFGVLPNSMKARWGSEWKKASIDYFDRTVSITFAGEQIPYKDHFYDLDPVYKDRAGDPLLRLTQNWRENEKKMAEFVTGKAVEIAHAMDVKEVSAFPGYRDYDVTRYQSTHVQGGTIMSTSPDRGTVSTYLQHWQIPNLIVLGASTFPNSGSANPTPTILAFTYRTADALVDRYFKNPQMLT
jgi:gluconate 2-dehydrogenase alpha chain